MPLVLDERYAPWRILSTTRVNAVPGQFAGGVLPSAYPEVANLPSAKQFLSELVDMQFQDVRVLLRLPDPQIAPDIGCNFTAAAVLTNLISGFSIWFFHSQWARTAIEPTEKKQGGSLSAKRFQGFIRAYFPRQPNDPTPPTIAKHLYAARNVLAHNLGIDDATWRTKVKKNAKKQPVKTRRQVISFSKPPTGMAEDEIVELETYATPPLAGSAIRRSGVQTTIYIPLLYWATGQMLRTALRAEPSRCDDMAAALLKAFPAPKP